MRETVNSILFASLALTWSMCAFASDLEITIHAGNGQTAPPGTQVPVSPAVLVTDAVGTPVAGESVAFAIESGGGLVFGASQTTDGQGIAEVGGWALGVSPGIKELRASHGESGNFVIFTAIAEAETALSVSLAVQEGESIVAGEPFTYEVYVSNDGPHSAFGVDVTMEFDPKIDEAEVTWTCEHAGGSAGCGASGSGGFSDVADVPENGWVRYEILASVPINLTSGEVVSSTEISPPAGLVLEDEAGGTDSSTATITGNPKPIFTDRFESLAD